MAVNHDKLTLLLVFATFLTAAGSIVMAYFIYAQVDVLQEQLRLSEKPYLLPSGAIEQGKAPVTAFIDQGKGEENWQLRYYVTNVSTKPAYGLRYYHCINDSIDIAIPEQGKWQALYEKNIIDNGDMYQCGADYIYRQAVLDKQKLGKSTIRHLMVRYTDEFQHEYMYHVAWQLGDYKVGEMPRWDMIKKVDLLKK